MKLIGITSSATENRSFLNKSYLNAFTRPGCVPVALPQFSIASRETITQDEYNEQNKEHINGLTESLSALCVSGGPDINPVVFDEPNWGSAGCDSERDMMELALINSFVLAGKPIIGICKGHQLIGRFLGLSNFTQDLGKIGELHNGNDREFKDRQEPVHSVYVLGAFRTYMRGKTGRADLNYLNINSYHHQAFLLSDDGKAPKSVKTAEQYSQWLGAVIKQYEGENQVDILSCTSMVIEGIEKPEAKIVSFQAHVEEYGNKGLSIQYWLDRYVLNG